MPLQHLLVVVESLLGVVPPLQQDLVAAGLDHGAALADDGLEVQQVRVLVALVAVERAELAVGVAEVGVGDVAVDDVGDRGRVGALQAQLVGDPAHVVQRGLFEEDQQLAAGQAPGQGLVQELQGQGRGAGRQADGVGGDRVGAAARGVLFLLGHQLLEAHGVHGTRIRRVVGGTHVAYLTMVNGGVPAGRTPCSMQSSRNRAMPARSSSSRRKCIDRSK